MYLIEFVLMPPRRKDKPTLSSPDNDVAKSNMAADLSGLEEILDRHLNKQSEHINNLFIKFTKSTNNDLEEVKKSQNFLNTKFEELIISVAELKQENKALRTESSQLRACVAQLRCWSLEGVRSQESWKNTWKILNEVVNKKKTTRKLPHEFKVNNQMIFNPKLIADRFCDYFTNVGPNLAKTSTFQSYLDGNFINSLFFEPTTKQEIGEIINSLRYCVASGYDNIPMWIVRDTGHLILEPLTHLINCCRRQHTNLYSVPVVPSSFG